MKSVRNRRPFRGRNFSLGNGSWNWWCALFSGRPFLFEIINDIWQSCPTACCKAFFIIAPYRPSTRFFEKKFGQEATQVLSLIWVTFNGSIHILKLWEGTRCLRVDFTLFQTVSMKYNIQNLLSIKRLFWIGLNFRKSEICLIVSISLISRRARRDHRVLLFISALFCGLCERFNGPSYDHARYY